MTITLLTATNLSKSFPHARGSSTSRLAVDDVSLELTQGETLAIVGESGSGKTTLARMLMRLIEPDSGAIRFLDADFRKARGANLRRLRSQIQMIFQDPYSSLNPRMRIAEIVAEPLAIHRSELNRAERRHLAAEALTAVGLDIASAARFPHEFSGGQRQRICIARALVLKPKLVVADEPVSALDVSIGAQIIQLLATLQRDYSLTYLLISHSLPVVAQLAGRVVVMQSGRIVEQGTVEKILSQPQQPYTKELLAAVPVL